MGPKCALWFLAVLLIATHLPQVKNTAPGEEACTPTPGDVDVVKTDDPYSSDQDGCACADPADTTTCYCLAGYGITSLAVPCTRGCTGSNCNLLVGGACVGTNIIDCECAPGYQRDPDANDACIAVPNTLCDPSADPGPDRSCACAAQTNPPDAALLPAYLDPATCFCIAGYTQSAADGRLCTQYCTIDETNCQVSLTDTTACAAAACTTCPTCRCAPGYAPRINLAGDKVTCEKVFCIQGEGNSVQQSYCIQDAATTPYDPYVTKCTSGTGPKTGTSYCSTDCVSGDPNCNNRDQTAACTATDEGCQCKPGYGLVANIDMINVLCEQVYCTKEDSNCLCATQTTAIDDCYCSYWTAPDKDHPGLCTSACKAGVTDCVRADTGERCYSDYVGSAGCHCRLQADKVTVPFSSAQGAGYANAPIDVTCDATPDCYYSGPNDNCVCTTANDATSCACDRNNGFIPDPNNPGKCVAAFCSIVGQFPEAGNAVKYTCTSYACAPGAALLSHPDCTLIAGRTAAAAVPTTTTYTRASAECVSGTPHTSTDCSCDYGYYPDTSGVCQALATANCDARFTECSECPTGNTQLTGCTCGLGYYTDERSGNARQCIRFCSPDTDANCVKTGTTTQCTTAGGDTYNAGSCVCAKKYMPQKSGTNYVCVEVTCDFLLESNCNKGTYIDSTTYTNVHCAEGFVPDPVASNIGECTGGCTDTTDANCMQGGSVTTPGSTQCTATPCFCRLGYNPVYDAANSKITCTATECNPLVALNGQCKCQYTVGAVSYDMTSCKCADKYAPSQPNDGTCTNECGTGQENCKQAASVTTECTGSGCVCRPGYTSVYNSVTQVYQCEPYECDSSVAGCVCSNPGDITSCTCSGTTTVGGATISYVGNKYVFPGYCRPLECDPNSDSNCACVDSSQLDTCYCKPGYAIDYKYAEINTDVTNAIDVTNYFSTACKPIDYRSSCPLAANVITLPNQDTGCTCSWSDKADNQYLCFCGLVIDEDCYVTSCETNVDDFAVESDGPCSMDTEVVNSVTYSYSMCRDGMLSNMAGDCTAECDWTKNSPNTCKETAETCNAGYVGHLDLFGNRNCYVVECEKGSTNCNCESTISKLHNWDNRLCRCAPGYAPNGAGGCTDECSVGSSHCNRTCNTAGTCCAYGYTPRTTWTADGTVTTGYTATVNCVPAACNTAVDATGCVCAADAYDEGLDLGQCACTSGTVHTGKGNCETPTVSTCISCSGTGTTSDCYATEILATQINTGTGVVSAGTANVFSLETCNLDTNYNQNYKSCELRYVKTDGGAPVVTRGCSSQTCSATGNTTLTCTTSSNVETCYKCCYSGANCNTFSAQHSGSIGLKPVAIFGYIFLSLIYAFKN